jgi:glycosyltransferase involved in cell wall biosynthesis
MALEKPVVANDHPDQRLVIEESGGGYCVPWSEEAFADAVCLLLKDPDGAVQMGKRGSSYATEKRSYRYCGEELAKTYVHLCTT